MTVPYAGARQLGGGDDRAYKIALDSNNNVYIGTTVQRGTKTGITEYPVHFSPTESLPMPPSNTSTISDAWKTAFLVKYNSNGQFQWKRALQGDVNLADGKNDSSLLDILIDSNDQIHFIIGLLHGTHLDNNISVPAQHIYNPNSTTGWGYIFKYYLVKYDTSGNYVSSMALPIGEGSMFAEPSFTFRYDEPRNRYYILPSVHK